MSVLSGGYFNQGKTTASSTTAGFFLGNEGGVSKFHIGNTTNSLFWNGTSLVVRGDIEATTLKANTVMVNTINITDNAVSEVGNTFSDVLFNTSVVTSTGNFWYDLPGAAVAVDATGTLASATGVTVKVDVNIDFDEAGGEDDVFYVRVVREDPPKVNDMDGNDIRLVAVGDGGWIGYCDTPSQFGAAVKQQPVQWKWAQSPTTANLNAVRWSAGFSKFVAVGDSGTIVQSSDGITWTQVTTGVTGSFKCLHACTTASGNYTIQCGGTGVLFVQDTTSSPSAFANLSTYYFANNGGRATITSIGTMALGATVNFVHCYGSGLPNCLPKYPDNVANYVALSNSTNVLNNATFVVGVHSYLWSSAVVVIFAWTNSTTRYYGSHYHASTAYNARTMSTITTGTVTTGFVDFRREFIYRPADAYGGPYYEYRTYGLDAVGNLTRSTTDGYSSWIVGATVSGATRMAVQTQFNSTTGYRVVAWLGQVSSKGFAQIYRGTAEYSLSGSRNSSLARPLPTNPLVRIDTDGRYFTYSFVDMTPKLGVITYRVQLMMDSDIYTTVNSFVLTATALRR